MQRFVNTADIEEGLDELGDPARLSAWLVEQGLANGSELLDDAALRRALSLRESLRSLLLANNGGPVYPVELATLNQAAMASPLRVRFQADGSSRLEPDSSGVDAALGRIIAAVFTAMADGTWPRLKACRMHSCRWAFYDRSKNRSSTWCDMATCGSRTKAETYRRRRRLGAQPGTTQPARVEPSSTPSAQ